MEGVKRLSSLKDAEIKKAKNVLAYEVTKLVHGEEEAAKAKDSSRALFSAGNAENMPTTTLTTEDFIDGSIDILTILTKAELVPSKSEARRAVDQGGVTVDGDKVTDIKTSYSKEALTGDGLIVKRGKKNFRKVIAE